MSQTTNQRPGKRWWFITYNNPPQDWKAALKELGSEWATGQLEQGQNGTPHIQAVLWYREKLSNKSWKGRPCYAKALLSSDVERSIAYCNKEESRIDGPVSFGIDPRKSSGHKQQRRRDWTKALADTVEGRIKEVEPSILIPYFTNLRKIEGFFKEGSAVQSPRGMWVFGKPGLGKSHYVRGLFPDAYIKPQNKWWDGYTGQDAVILDDLDKSGTCLSHYLKIWMDQYSFEAEFKGGTLKPSYKTFCVTSNYLPGDLWDDTELVAAINRRAIFVRFYGYCQYIEGSHLGDIPAEPHGLSGEYISKILSDFIKY